MIQNTNNKEKANWTTIKLKLNKIKFCHQIIVLR